MCSTNRPLTPSNTHQQRHAKSKNKHHQLTPNTDLHTPISTQFQCIYTLPNTQYQQTCITIRHNTNRLRRMTHTTKQLRLPTSNTSNCHPTVSNTQHQLTANTNWHTTRRSQPGTTQPATKCQQKHTSKWHWIPMNIYCHDMPTKPHTSLTDTQHQPNKSFLTSNTH